jgi:RNA polymerase sigma-70 factor (ECF subfamily)
VSPALFRFLTARAASREAAEDLLQDCWLRIHGARHTYRPEEPVLPWIYAIAHNTWIDAYRREKRQQARERAMEGMPEGAHFARPDSGPSALLLEQLLAELPESQREVIWLLKIDGLSLEETARATSSTIGSVKQKAHRAYERMRRMLGPREGKP